MIDNERKFRLFIIGCVIILIFFALAILFFQAIVPKVLDAAKKIEIIEYGCCCVQQDTAVSFFPLTKKYLSAIFLFHIKK